MKAVITDYQYPNVDTERALIEGAGHTLVTYQEKEPTRLRELLRDADAVITQYASIDRSVLESMTRCKMVIKYGIGVNNIDVEAATERGIYVCNVPDYGIEEVSDHAVTLLLALGKKLPILADALRAGDWGNASVVPLRRLCTCTVGLIGFGRIPQAVARKLSGFGMKLLAYDPWASKEAAERLHVELVDLDTLYARSDFLSVHCPLTNDTHHLIDAEALAKMKPTAFLVNTARGAIVDEAALIEALQNGRIAGAGLDVFENEPITPDHPLLHLPNVIATPHSAWYSETAIAVLQQKAAEEVVRVLGGEKPKNNVNLKGV